tara:strand:- start:23 stop:358 length:336 start_codon:yes stop_codon:yes gene_type:complete
MNLDPRNRHLLVEFLPEEEKEEEKPAVLLPDSYSPVKDQYIAVKVIETAPDCLINCNSGQTIVVERSMLNEVKFEDNIFHLVLENYVLGVIEGQKNSEMDDFCGTDTERYK